MKKSKPGYSIFSPNTLTFRKLMVKAGHKQLKKARLPELAHDIFNLPHSNHLDKHLMVSEVLWDYHGRSVIFPGNKDFFQTLLKSNFALDGTARLDLPHSSFILAIPKGFEVDGVTIPSVIVNYNKADNRKDRYDLATKVMGLPEMDHAENNLSGSDSLTFFYQDPYEDEGVIVQSNQTPSQIGSALKAKTVDEYAEIIGTIPKDMISPVAMSPSSTDYLIQFTITKIIAGISVYMSAKNITKLNEGLPNNGRLAISNLKKDVRYSFSHLPLPTRSGTNDSSDSLGTRIFHFRNLKAPVYYQNEHKHKEPGSRWVFVNEAKLGEYEAEHIE